MESRLEMDCRDGFLCSATVATSAAVLKLITGRNLFSPATPSAHIIFNLSGERIIDVWGLKQKRQRCTCPERISDPCFNESFSTYMSCVWLHGLQKQNNVYEAQSIRDVKERQGKEWWKKKKKKQEWEDLSCARTAQTQGLCCSFNARLGRLSWWMDCRQENKSGRSITGQEAHQLSLANPRALVQERFTLHTS